MIIIFLEIFFINSNSSPLNISYNYKEIIRIGIYEDDPYISIDNKGNISGYYYDLINLLKKKYDFEPQYVICTLSEGLNMLETGNIDVMFGLTITDNRQEKFLFNKYRVCVESNALITKLDFENLNEINNVRLGLPEYNSNSELILDFLNSKEIKVTPVYAKSFDELKNLLDNNKIDIMLGSIITNKKYNIIYRFTGHQVYIAGNKNSKHILDNFDDAIKSLGNKSNSKISRLYEKYFLKLNTTSFKNIILFFPNILLLLLTLLLIIPKLKLTAVRNKVKFNITNNSYFFILLTNL